MKLLFAEWMRDKHFFDYQTLANDHWRDKIGDAKRKFNINFDLENDEAVGQREIKIDQDFWDHTDCKFKCEIRSAGGDWEHPVFYFRCQLVSGYCAAAKKYNDPFFCFVPGKNEGNSHLVKRKGEWYAPDGNEDLEAKPSERKCWQALKDYLKQEVQKEIADVKSNRDGYEQA